MKEKNEAVNEVKMDKKTFLTKRKVELKKDIARERATTLFTYILPILILVLSFCGITIKIIWTPLEIFDERGLFFIFVFVISIILLIFAFLIPKTRRIMLQNELINVEDEIELFEIGDSKFIEGMEIRLKQKQKELKRNYDLNYSHTRSIFTIGIIVIFMGIFIIILSLILFRDFKEKSVVPIIAGCISGLLVDFIGAIFIRIYTENMRVFVQFHNSLINRNNDFFATVLIEHISDEKIKNETIARIAKMIVNKKT